MSSLAALPSLKSGSPFWNRASKIRTNDLRRALESVDNRAFADAVAAECRNRHRLFAEGVRRYRAFPRPERAPGYTEIWRKGTTTLRDYGDNSGDGPTLLIVPSLVNRADVLDLGCGRSFVDMLAGLGIRPLLVDWDAPGPDETAFDVGDYVVERLEPALSEAVGLNDGKPVAVAGYCMGGCLALALAARRPESVGALALLATPWDFHAGGDPLIESQIAMLEASLPVIEPILDTLDEMPVDLLQAMFAGLDPWLTPAKFIRFAGLGETSPDAALFVALEDWLNDGVPLTAPVARECFRDWYIDNVAAKTQWTVGGEPVRPENVRAPSIAFIPGRDHIVPPPSARSLAEAIPGCDVRPVPAGHIGMVTGSRARELLGEPLAAWLREVAIDNRRSSA